MAKGSANRGGKSRGRSPGAEGGLGGGGARQLGAAALAIAAIAVVSYSCTNLMSFDSAKKDNFPVTLLASDASVAYSREVACVDPIHRGRCGRRVVDGLFEDTDIEALLAIAEKGMAVRPSLGGPTILDLNTGYLRDTAGLVNLFESTAPRNSGGDPSLGYMQSNPSESGVFDDADFELYERIIRKLKGHVQESFGAPPIYFTAPTFITRLDGNESWKPRAIHDEYWHVHSDMLNTPHYQYSGLLYLSTYGQDFEGGLFSFTSGDDDASAPEEVVEPRRGRVSIFTSGPENPHRVARVTRGRRLVLSFWFTLDAAREFDIFLDGKAHRTFSARKAGMKSK